MGRIDIFTDRYQGNGIDVFGATLHRLGDHLTEGTASSVRFRVTKAGKVTRGSSVCELPELAEYATQATDGHTLAVTVPRSHSVYLIAEVLDV